MKYLFAVCVSLFLVSTVAAHHHKTPKFCTWNIERCKKAGIDIECVSAEKDSTCAEDVINGKADFTLLSANGMVEHMDKLKIVVGMKRLGMEKFVRYYGLAIVKKGTRFTLNDLKGKKSCHTGVGRTVGWNIPVGYLLFTNQMKFTKNQYKSAADFFGESCAQGIKDPKLDVSPKVKDDLCSLCSGIGDDRCTYEDPYAGYHGAFICMAEGNKDRVGFVKETTASQVFRKYPGKYGSASDYELLCKDGSRKPLNQYLTCHIDKRPESAFVASKDTPDNTVKKYADMLKAADIKDLAKGGLVWRRIESLEDYYDSVERYVGSYRNHYKALTGPHDTVPKLCTWNITKCEMAGIHDIKCVSPEKDSTCVKDVIDGKADLTLSSANEMTQNADQLKIVIGTQVKGLEPFVQYYGLAVVQKGTKFNLKQLKGKKSCHTGVGRTVGWKIPVGYLLYTKEMKFTKDQYKSTADFFNESCAQGIKETKLGASQEVQDDLCSLCKGTGADRCTNKDPYAGYHGAFICMAEGNKDRVGFVKQTTAPEVFAKYPTKYGSASDYELLCKDGSKKPLDQYLECNIDKRPASAFVTSKNMSDDMIKEYARMLKLTDINDLIKGGIIWSTTESLQNYEKSVKEYVGSYGDHYNALAGPRDTAPKLCAWNITKCEMAGIHDIKCVSPEKDSTCVKDVIDGKADLALSSANEMTQNADQLKIVIGTKVKGLEPFVQYYGLAVVQKGTTFNLKQLKGKKSCHTGVGRTVGWKIPVGYLLFTRQMKFTKDQYNSTADFFNESCAQGIKDPKLGASQEVKDDLCSMCNGTGANRCTNKDPYAGYHGAFICMAEGNKDRVGFVKQTTAPEVFAKYPQKYGTASDYELLCKDGSKKPLDQYLTCNIDKRPASAFIASKKMSDDMIKKYAAILKATDINDLIKGGIVWSSTESLRDYSKSVKEYVGSYGDHYNALAGPRDTAPKFCTWNVTKCEMIGIDIKCVSPEKDSTCVKDVITGKADLTAASANEMSQDADNLKMVMGLKLTGLEPFVRYYGLAVVQKGTTFNLTQLKGKKSCHTGVGRTVGWKIPVGYLLFTRQMKFTKDQYKSTADFFNESCAQGIKDPKLNASQEVKDDLCSLCNGTGADRCTYKDPYSGYHGAFICMAEGNKDRVGFVKETTAPQVFARYPEKYGSASDYELLCKDGSRKALDQYLTCNIDKRPASAFVASKKTSDDTIKKYAAMLKATDINKLIKGGLVSYSAESLQDYSKSVKKYLGSYGDHYNALAGPRETVPKFCTKDVKKCEMAGLNIKCVSPGKDTTCEKDIIAGKADLTLSSANGMVENADGLKIVIGLKLKGLEKFVRYYGLAVVKKGTSFTLKDLKGKKSCHTGVGRTVGWNIPVGYLLSTEEMKFTKDQYKSASDFFGKSCAYGIKDKDDVSQQVKDDLCSLCSGTGADRCTSKDPYAGYHGAFKCMAEGDKDRVGFVKQTTAPEVFAKYPGKYGTANDYELLCKDGSKKALDQYMTCNIDKRPAEAFVTSTRMSDDTINKYAAMLKEADIKDLLKGGIVWSGTESLQDSQDSKSVKEYVGDYGKHYNALTGLKADTAT